jgi:hypothetical protein
MFHDLSIYIGREIAHGRTTDVVRAGFITAARILTFGSGRGTITALGRADPADALFKASQHG